MCCTSNCSSVTAAIREIVFDKKINMFMLGKMCCCPEIYCRFFYLLQYVIVLTLVMY